MRILSNLSVSGLLGLNSVADANTDTDKFLVLDSSGIVRYRTGAEVFSDIGAGGAAAYTSVLQHTVKAGEALTKGQAVYVTGADGTNMIVGKASNATEATSSKTLGLIAQNLATNDQGFVVTEGLLAGIDTSTAQAGDPVWLGTNGNLIFGLANKPYAPTHMVFIGIVTRAQQNNGEIFVKVQNGFELQELHNVQITSTPADNTVLAYETSTSLYKMKSIPTLLGYTPVTNARSITINGTTYDLSADRSWSVGTHTGNLTTGYVPKATGATTLTDSLIYDNGSGIGINTSSPYESSAFKLDVNGGLLIKNTSGTTAQLVLINSNPATGGNNGFVQLSAGGNTATAFGQWQTYYGMSVAAGALRLQPAGGQVLIGTTTTSAFLTDINGTLRVSGQLTLGSTISNNTYVYTMPGASGTLALVSQIPSLSGYLTIASADATYLTQSSAASIYLSQTSASNTYLTISGAASTYLSQANASNTYLTISGASSIYLSQTSASNTYLTINGASSIYLSQTSASNTYLTINNAASTYVSLSGSYANPSWITSLAWSKITGAPAFLTSYTETDTLASVTGRGATTSNTIQVGKLGIGRAAASNESISVENPEGTWLIQGFRSGSSVGGLHTNSGVLHVQAADVRIQASSTATWNGDTLATRPWVQAQGYLTSGSFLPLAGGTMTGAIIMSGTQQIRQSGFAGIEYYNGTAQWQGYIGTENNTGNLRYNSFNGAHTWYANSNQTMSLTSAGQLTVADFVSTTGYIRSNNHIYNLTLSGSAQNVWAKRMLISESYYGNEGLIPFGSGLGKNTLWVHDFGASRKHGAVISCDNNGEAHIYAVDFANGTGDGTIGGSAGGWGWNMYYDGLGDEFFRMRIGDAGTWTEVLTIDRNENVRWKNTTGFSINGNTVWHAGNDGAGSGLDADLLDGVQLDNIVWGNARGTNDSVTTDNDNLDKTGYYTSSAFTTKPSGVSDWMYIEHIKLYNANALYQKQIGYDTYDDRMWVRTENGGTWSSWKQIWTSSSLTNLNQLTNGPGYITGESDTLATVTARGATTSTTLTINKTGTLISHAGMSDAIGYNASYGTYIGSPVGGTYYLYANGTFFDNGTIRTLIHSGNIGSQSVNYANSAGSVAWGNVTSKPSNIMYYQSFTLDANTMDSNATGFTYSVNAPFTGPIARFSTGGSYDMWLGGNYGGSGTEFYLRTRNGDIATLNPWRRIWTNADSTISAGGDFRAPIFYDSADTTYYVDPGSNGTRAAFLNGNVWISPKPESYGEGIAFLMPSQATWGGLRWLRSVGNYTGAWALGYFGNESNDNIGFHSAGTNGWRLDHSWNMTVIGSVRAPIFYDSDDTGYYADFNSTSNSAMRIRGGILFGPNPTWGAYLRVGGDGNPDTSVANIAATNGNLHLDSRAGYAMYLNNYANGIIYLNGGTYYISANGSFYNGTASYANSAGSAPNGSNINNYYNSTAGEGYGFRFWNGDEAYKLSMGVGAQYQYGPVNDYSIKLHMGSGAGRGITMGITGSTPTFAHNTTSGNTQIAGSFTTTSVNAPSGYTSFGNPWGTANSAFFPNGITTAGGTNWIYGFTYIGNAPANGAGHEFNANGSMRSTSSHRATIYYDDSDTSFYLDPNSASNLQSWTSDTAARIGRSRYWTNRWAIYGTANDYMTGTNGWGTEHGNWDNAWKGGFSGWDIWGTGTAHPQGGGYIHAQGIISGQHAAASDGSTAYGWMMVGAHNATENRYWLRGKWGSSTSGWVEMITTGNIASYTAGNVNNISSAVGGSYTWTATNYFRSTGGGYSGSLASPPLQAYSDSNNSAYMSFHKGGHYAVNLGLDADNVMRIGGWSASANRWQLDMSGNMTVAGDVTAYSDARVKENVITVDNALSKVLSLRGVYYNRTDSEDKNRKIGVIAQETMTVIPEVVNQDNAGMYNVSYGNLGGLFIEAFKEQQKKIEAQDKVIEELKSKLDAVTK